MDHADNQPRTLIAAALFTDGALAARAFAELKEAGFARTEISGTGSDSTEAVSAVAKGRQSAPFFREHDSSAAAFESELAALGFPERDAKSFVKGLLRGGSLVTTDAGHDPETAVEILRRHRGDVRTARSSTSAATGGTVSDVQTMQLFGERLRIDKERIEHGEVTVRKELVTEMRTIEIPVTREDLVIERRPSTDPASTLGVAQPETIRIALTQEEVVIDKRVVVLEDVSVEKRSIAETAHVSETVLREDLVVHDPTENHPSPAASPLRDR